MTNIKELNVKKYKRNAFIIDMVEKVKANIDKEEELLDMLILCQAKDGRAVLMGQTVVPANPLNSIGLLELGKQSIMGSINDFDIEEGDCE